MPATADRQGILRRAAGQAVRERRPVVEPVERKRRREVPVRPGGSRAQRDRVDLKRIVADRGSRRPGREAGRRCTSRAARRRTWAGPASGKLALRIEPKHGGSLRSLPRSSRSPLSGLRPQSAVNAAALWLVIGWCMPRRIASRSITRAVWGMCSLTRRPGTLGGDRAEVAPDLAGCLGLHVPGIEMAGTAVIEDQDARPDSGIPLGATARQISLRVRHSALKRPGRVSPKVPRLPMRSRLRRLG